MVIHGRIDRRREEELRSSTKGGSESGICYDPVFWAVLCLAGARLCKNQLINKPFVGHHGQKAGVTHTWNQKREMQLKRFIRKHIFLFIFKSGCELVRMSDGG